MMAWKRAYAKSSFLYSAGLAQSLRNLLSKLAKVLIKFDLRPDGGSIVILIDVYRTLTGKLGLGIDVSQILNSGFIDSVSDSTIASNRGIQEIERWQF